LVSFRLPNECYKQTNKYELRTGKTAENMNTKSTTFLPFHPVFNVFFIKVQGALKAGTQAAATSFGSKSWRIKVEQKSFRKSSVGRKNT